MDFGLSPEQELLRQSAREFLARECPPSRVREAFESDAGRSERLDRAMARMGWNGIRVPERFGGLGLGMLDAAVLLTELGAAALPGPFFFSAILATTAIAIAGRVGQKREWLPRLAAGDRIATVAWLEDTGRLDPPGIQLRARRHGRSFTLDGRKLFVPYAGAADLLVVAARTGTGERGITLFLVPSDAPGVRIHPLESIDRTRRLSEVELRRVRVGEPSALGKTGGGWPVLARLLDVAAVGLAADGLGGSDRVLSLSVDYAKTREQFGRPIGSFQAIKHIAAEMVAEIEPARSLVWYAAHALDAIPADAPRAASMAKAHLSEVYSRNAGRAVEIHGGIGFTWEHDVHFWFKRAKWNELSFGDPAFHRERIARIGRYGTGPSGRGAKRNPGAG